MINLKERFKIGKLEIEEVEQETFDIRIVPEDPEPTHKVLTLHSKHLLSDDDRRMLEDVPGVVHIQKKNNYSVEVQYGMAFTYDEVVKSIKRPFPELKFSVAPENIVERLLKRIPYKVTYRR